ncbi:hypothetical protein BDZ91DRAFT_802865 [Kalaharituber pfeilii]|nr:hypothetical protein BDZ91DRAFT_802865 [Kalaharituber pfeilii]
MFAQIPSCFIVLSSLTALAASLPHGLVSINYPTNCSATPSLSLLTNHTISTAAPLITFSPLNPRDDAPARFFSVSSSSTQYGILQISVTSNPTTKYGVLQTPLPSNKPALDHSNDLYGDLGLTRWGSGASYREDGALDIFDDGTGNDGELAPKYYDPKTSRPARPIGAEQKTATTGSVKEGKRSPFIACDSDLDVHVGDFKPLKQLISSLNSTKSKKVRSTVMDRQPIVHNKPVMVVLAVAIAGVLVGVLVL